MFGWPYLLANTHRASPYLHSSEYRRSFCLACYHETESCRRRPRLLLGAVVLLGRTPLRTLALNFPSAPLFKLWSKAITSSVVLGRPCNVFQLSLIVVH